MAANLPPKPDGLAPSRYSQDDRHYLDSPRTMAPMRHGYDDRDVRARSDRRSPPRSRTYGARDSYVAPYDRRDSERYRDHRDDRERVYERDWERDGDRRIRGGDRDRDRERGRERPHHRNDWRSRDRDTPPRDMHYDRRPVHDRDYDWRRQAHSRRDRPRRDDSPPRRMSRSPRRTSMSPRHGRADYHDQNSRPRSRSPRSVNRNRPRSPSPERHPKSESHSAQDWHVARSPPPFGVPTPKRSHSRSATPPLQRRHSSERQRHPEAKEHGMGSSYPGKRSDVEMKAEPRSHTPNLVAEGMTERGGVEELAAEPRPVQQRRSPPRAPRSHTRIPAGSPAQFQPHQSTPSSKLERQSRSSNFSDMGSTSKTDSQVNSIRNFNIPPFKPFRNPAIENEITRLQGHRAHLKSEHVQIARDVRRALHELDLTTTDLRAAENRRKMATEQMDKIRGGALGINTASAS